MSHFIFVLKYIKERLDRVCKIKFKVGIMNYISTLEKLQDKVITLNIDKNMYSKNTLLKACYKFTDMFYIFITPNVNDQSIYTIYFQLKNEAIKNEAIKVENLIGEFNNEILDQELRSVILSETQKVRDTIVTRALLSGQPNDN